MTAMLPFAAFMPGESQRAAGGHIERDKALHAATGHPATARIHERRLTVGLVIGDWRFVIRRLGFGLWDLGVGPWALGLDEARSACQPDRASATSLVTVVQFLAVAGTPNSRSIQLAGNP